MEQKFNYIDEKFADLQLLRYRLPDFDKLSLRQKKYIYYLSKAALSGRDITTDQFGAYNIRIRKLFEAIYTGYDGNRDCSEFQNVVVYLKRGSQTAFIIIMDVRSLCLIFHPII